MPTSTYFRLPEEKRERLMAACWSAMTRVRFAEVSVNRIIVQAHIPRGSFYQYFEDKEDMICYLLEDMRTYFITLIQDLLKEAGGDLFAFPLGAYDRFVYQGGTDPVLARFIQVLRLNPGMDARIFATNGLGFLPDSIWEMIDPSFLRQQDREYAEQVFRLLCAVLAYSVADTLRNPEQQKKQRKVVQMRTEMLKYGCAAGKEVTK